MTLGGLDHEEYLINGDIVMGQSFRISHGEAVSKDICRKCECRYARSSFLPGVTFDGNTQKDKAGNSHLRNAFEKEQRLYLLVGE